MFGFGWIRGRRKVADGKLCIELAEGFANQCFTEVSKSLQSNGLDAPAKRALLSAESVIFFHQFALSMTNFFDQTPPFGMLLKAKIHAALGGSFDETYKTQDENVERLYRSVDEDFNRKVINSLTRAAWAGNGVAADFVRDKHVHYGALVTYVVGVCKLQMADGKDWSAIHKAIEAGINHKYAKA